MSKERPLRLDYVVCSNIAHGALILAVIALLSQYPGVGWSISSAPFHVWISFFTAAFLIGSSAQALRGRPNADLKMLAFATLFYGHFIYEGIVVIFLSESWGDFRLWVVATSPGLIFISLNLWAVLSARTRTYFDSRIYV